MQKKKFSGYEFVPSGYEFVPNGYEFVTGYEFVDVKLSLTGFYSRYVYHFVLAVVVQLVISIAGYSHFSSG